MGRKEERSCRETCWTVRLSPNVRVTPQTQIRSDSIQKKKKKKRTTRLPIAQLVKIRLQCRRPRFNSWVGKIHWRRDRLPIPVFSGFPGGLAGKESTCNVGELGSIPGLGRSPGEVKGYPLQYSDLENSMDYIVYGVEKS